MPPPLGKTPTKKMPRIDVLGVEDSASTRSAVRFFRERRIVVRFVDLRKKPIEPADLRRFLERLGPALLEAETEPLTDRGKLMARIHAEPHLLRLPLVRYGDEITAGPSETTWRAWLARRNGAAR
jgi:arsenate reductase (glutaredoxin)